MRSARHIGEAQIELRHFVAGDLPGIGHRNIGGKWIAGLDGVGRHGQSAVSEGGVTQAVAEGIERLALEVAISAALHRVIFKGRKLVDAGIERDRQASGGIVAAGESLRHCRAALFARIPRIENGVGVLLGPVHRERAAVGEHHHQRLAGCGQRFEQVLFRLGQVEAGAVAALEARLRCTCISSPSSSLVMPTTATTTSAFFAASMAAGCGLRSTFDHTRLADGVPFSSGVYSTTSSTGLARLEMHAAQLGSMPIAS